MTIVRPQTSTRDPNELAARLTAWLATKVTNPRVCNVVVPESNGMSSETLLFDLKYDQEGTTVNQPCAARLAPDPEALPVFPVYDMGRQFEIMRMVGAKTKVPVPKTLWYEPGRQALGAPFFVMEKVEGLVPPDVMPYPFGSWLSEAPAEDQYRLQREAVRVLVELHRADLGGGGEALLDLRGVGKSAGGVGKSAGGVGKRASGLGESALADHVAAQQRYYEWVTSDGARSPLIDAGFAWLQDRWPKHEGPAVISWGDSRIGNMMFRDFEPVAVLDWEMAALGPPEIDLGWMIYLHRFLDDIAIEAGLPGMPSFMLRADVVATYEQLGGRAPCDMDFYLVYAALRHAIVMSRVARRQVLFGEIAMPADPDDLIMHRKSLAKMLEGTYWEEVEARAEVSR